MLDPLQCVVKLSKKRPEVFHDGERVTGLDGVVPRIGASITFYGLAVLRQFEMMGVFPANESQAISRSRDKLRSLQLLSRHDIGIPPTAFARRREDIRSAIRRVGGAPVILKLLEGTQGMGVILAESVKSAESVLDAMSSLRQNILIQAFIEEAAGDRLSAPSWSAAGWWRRCRARPARGSSAATSTAAARPRGSSCRRSTSPTAVHAAEVLGLNIAGVDMIPSKEGPMVLEVNSSPGLEGIEGATGRRRGGPDDRLRPGARSPGASHHPGSGLGAGAVIREPLTFAGVPVALGQTAELRLKVAESYAAEPVAVPVTVVRGDARAHPVRHRHGPRRRAQRRRHPARPAQRHRLRGLQGDADRRAGRQRPRLPQPGPPPARPARPQPALSPAAARGSLTARLADVLFREVIRQSDFGIDLHTAGGERTNYPQIRADLANPAVAELARAFGCPLIVGGAGPERSLRRTAVAAGVPTVVYEAGSARRFERPFIEVGIEGVLNVLRHLEMMPGEPAAPPLQLWIERTHWIRSRSRGDPRPQGGPRRSPLRRGQTISVHSNPFGRERSQLKAPRAGIVLGPHPAPPRRSGRRDLPRRPRGPPGDRRLERSYWEPGRQR